jgi:hypothetical protein
VLVTDRAGRMNAIPVPRSVAKSAGRIAPNILPLHAHSRRRGRA